MFFLPFNCAGSIFLGVATFLISFLASLAFSSAF